MNIDFENDFTASLATVLFVGFSAVTAIWLFASLWFSSGSVLLAIVSFALIAPFAAVGVGIMTTIVSWLIALFVSGLRGSFTRKQHV